MSNIEHLKKLLGEASEIRKGNLRHELGESKKKKMAEKMSKKNHAIKNLVKNSTKGYDETRKLAHRAFNKGN